MRTTNYRHGLLSECLRDSVKCIWEIVQRAVVGSAPLCHLSHHSCSSLEPWKPVLPQPERNHGWQWGLSPAQINPTPSSSVTLFSSCPQSFPASESFPMSWLFASGGQSIGASASPFHGHELGQIPGDGEGQGSLVSCSPWGCTGLDLTERVNNSNNYWNT